MGITSKGLEKRFLFPPRFLPFSQSHNKEVLIDNQAKLVLGDVGVVVDKYNTWNILDGWWGFGIAIGEDVEGRCISNDSLPHGNLIDKRKKEKKRIKQKNRV